MPRPILEGGPTQEDLKAYYRRCLQGLLDHVLVLMRCARADGLEDLSEQLIDLSYQVPSIPQQKKEERDV